MNPNGKFYNKDGRNIYVTRAICDYFSKATFLRLLEESKYAIQNNAEFYLGLYSDDLLEHLGKNRIFKGTISDEDRINLAEALDFVDGAFLINSLDKNLISSELDSKLLRQKEQQTSKHHMNIEKKYKLGYASGAFSNFHKGHMEHLRDMSKQCEKVIVAANSDRLIREYKHKISSVDEKTRRLILSHIKYVDIAIVTDDYDKIKAIDKVRNICGEQFEAIFVGSDWKGSSNWKDFEQRLNEYGIDIVFTDRPKDGISTSKIDSSKAKKIEPEER